MRGKQTAENRIGAGKPGPGRPVGSANQTTRMLKERSSKPPRRSEKTVPGGVVSLAT